MHFKLSENEAPADGEEPDGEVGYLYLTKHPGMVQGCVKKQLRLLDVIEGYRGPDIYLDFDASGELIGIEVLED